MIPSRDSDLNETQNSESTKNNQVTNLSMPAAAVEHVMPAAAVEPAIPTAADPATPHPNKVGDSDPPLKLEFIVHPSNVMTGATIFPAVKVEIQDTSGKRVNTATDNVTIMIDSKPELAILAGDLTVTAIEGVSTFNNISLITPGKGYILKATSENYTPAISNAFDVISDISFELQILRKEINDKKVDEKQKKLLNTLTDAVENLRDRKEISQHLLEHTRDLIYDQTELIHKILTKCFWFTLVFTLILLGLYAVFLNKDIRANYNYSVNMAKFLATLKIKGDTINKNFYTDENNLDNLTYINEFYFIKKNALEKEKESLLMYQIDYCYTTSITLKELLKYKSIQINENDSYRYGWIFPLEKYAVPTDHNMEAVKTHYNKLRQRIKDSEKWSSDKKQTSIQNSQSNVEKALQSYEKAKEISDAICQIKDYREGKLKETILFGMNKRLIIGVILFCTLGTMVSLFYRLRDGEELKLSEPKQLLLTASFQVFICIIFAFLIVGGLKVGFIKLSFLDTANLSPSNNSQQEYFFLLVAFGCGWFERVARYSIERIIKPGVDAK